MDVQFRRTGERRYAVTVIRENQAPLEMNPAPGYDPFMPHDLLHFIVESELGLSQGIYGQIAQGGTAGTFRPTGYSEHQRKTARLRKRVVRRGEKLQREGRQESALSEQATYLCLYEWLSRSAQAERKKLARQMHSQAEQARGLQTLAKATMLSTRKLERICARMDELSSAWSSLKIGETLTIQWGERI